jgi:hypothetical protein
MNIHYRIVKVDPAAHGIVVRYFTDEVTEMDLANSLNPDGSIKLNADGYPVTTRTDVLMSIYDTPTPSREEVEKRIMLNAPVQWLKLQEDIKNPEIDTKMSEMRNLVGDSKSFTSYELKDMKDAIKAETENPVTEDEDSVRKAYGVITTLTDSLKVLAIEDPNIIEELASIINYAKSAGKK